jgi:hypothetical protein
MITESAADCKGNRRLSSILGGGFGKIRRKGAGKTLKGRRGKPFDPLR